MKKVLIFLVFLISVLLLRFLAFSNSKIIYHYKNTYKQENSIINLKDINEDEKIDLLDAKFLSKLIIDGNYSKDKYLPLGDINNDNILKMNDVVLIIKKIYESDPCLTDIKFHNLSGMHGVAINNRDIYETLTSTKRIDTAIAGTKFEILGENNNNGDYWAINYNGKCGWINAKYMAINLKEYIPSITYNITNANKSIFKSSGKNIEGLTSQKLYTDDYNNFVPVNYPFAIKIKAAQIEANKNGDTIIIYDAYRPKSVTNYASEKLNTLYINDEEVKNNINYSTENNSSWGKSWFLASSISTHNKGCAIDASLKKISGEEYEMPTQMHELSTLAIKYRGVGIDYIPTNYSKRVKESEGAKKLSEYMMNYGKLSDLASEWWHYQDDTCFRTIDTAADFWSNIK